MKNYKEMAKEILPQMTLDEKIELQNLSDMLRTAGVPRLGVPSIMMVDGPTGLRKCENGKTEPAVCFPTVSALASGFDTDVAYDVGAAIGMQCREHGVNVLLAPGVNIKRDALCGRNFEYASEDPYHAGVIGAAYIKGVQSSSVGACVKHFACNSTENGRNSVNSVVDERALREIYLSAFEYIIKNAAPDCVMSAYNSVNGEFCAENKHLIDILKNEWKFGGMLMTDWWANDNRVRGIKAGTDIECPSGDKKCVKDAIESGELDEKELDKCVERILELTFKYKDVTPVKADFSYQHSLAAKAAEKCAVLLKNDGNILPFAKNERIAVIGEFAREPHIQGEGSSCVKPLMTDSLLKIMYSEKADYEFSLGWKSGAGIDKELEKKAVEAAKRADKAVIIAGTEKWQEAEGYNRESIRLPANQLHLIKKICCVNENTVVVLQCGSVVSLPFKNIVKGILLENLAGEASGKALFNLLYGNANPSGRLAQTYIKSEKEQPFENSNLKKNIVYSESIYVGYRYYDKAQSDIYYPFGYGLSYTDFEYSAVMLSKKKIKDGESVTLKYKIRNTGKRFGGNVTFAFVSAECGGIFRVKKELKGFSKVYLEAGEEKEVSIKLPYESFRYFDIESGSWRTDGGKYKIILAENVNEEIASLPLVIDSDCASADKSAVLQDYYNLPKTDFTLYQFKKLYGSELPEERRSGDEINADTMLYQTSQTTVGRLTDTALKTGGTLLKPAFPALAMGANSLRMMPVRAFPMMAPCFTTDFVKAYIKLTNENNLENAAQLFKALAAGVGNKR